MFGYGLLSGAIAGIIDGLKYESNSFSRIFGYQGKPSERQSSWEALGVDGRKNAFEKLGVRNVRRERLDFFARVVRIVA